MKQPFFGHLFVLCPLLALGCIGAEEREYVAPEQFDRIETDTGSFAYVEEGDGPLVLLLHGFPDTPQTWDAVRPALADAGFRAVSPWLRGYGPSHIPSGLDAYKPDAYGQDVAALIEAFGYDSAIVVGHDFGASLAYAGTLLNPEVVDKLVTVAIPHPGHLDADLGLLWRARHFWRLSGDGAEGLVRANDFEYIDGIYERWSPNWDVPADETEAVKNLFAGAASLTGALNYYRALDLSPGGDVAVPFDRNIQVPTLTFSGESDGVAGPEAFDAAADGFDDEYTVQVLPGGHFLHREDPAAFIEKLLSFVAEG